jgi:endoplasmic reticulum junction formation protein lunapark
VSKTEKHLKDLNKQRQETIEKLKVATKYNSTQELLEKYGGETPPKSTPQENQSVGLKGKEDERRAGGAIQQQFTGRTGIPPPPTANIRRQQDGISPVAPNQSPQPIPRNGLHQSGTNSGGRVSMSPQDIYSGFEEPGFAPNAFPTPHYSDSQHRWYDRLLDVLLGEDETLPRNRIALICQNCRLVNGQAPPGVKTLEEIGRWRCGSCGAWNDSESEARKILDNITKSQTVDPERETVDDHPDILEGTDESATSDSAILVDRAEDHPGSEDGEQSEHEAKETRNH